MADDTDTDWLALADFLDAHANDMRAWTEDEPKFRATAEGLRQLAAITAERDQLRAERTQLTGDSMTDLKMTYAYEAGHEDGKAEVREQLDAITAAIGDPDELRGWVEEHNGIRLRQRVVDILAASLSPTPTPQHCPTCGSTNRDRVKPNDCEIIPDAWHDSGQP